MVGNDRGRRNETNYRRRTRKEKQEPNKAHTLRFPARINTASKRERQTQSRGSVPVRCVRRHPIELSRPGKEEGRKMVPMATLFSWHSAPLQRKPTQKVRGHLTRERKAGKGEKNGRSILRKRNQMTKEAWKGVVTFVGKANVYVARASSVRRSADHTAPGALLRCVGILALVDLIVEPESVTKLHLQESGAECRCGCALCAPITQMAADCKAHE